MHNSHMERIKQKFITQDLAKKMVFLTGPRQVGKTFLAQEIAKGFQKSVYLNYDSFEDREIIKNAGWLPDTELLILDELHKVDGWKNHLKGIYDTRPRNLKIAVNMDFPLFRLSRICVRKEYLIQSNCAEGLISYEHSSCRSRKEKYHLRFASCKLT